MGNSLKAVLAFLVPYLAAFFIPEIAGANEFVLLLAGVGGVAAITVLVAEFINKLVDLHKNLARAISWAVAIGLTFFSEWIGFGFDGYVLWQLLVAGVTAGFVANGYFTMEFIKPILDALLPPPTRSGNIQTY